MRRLFRLFGLLVMAVAYLSGGSAMAASYSVTNTADSGPGSLRAAISASNDPAVADTISISATGSIQLESQLPPVTDDVAITGPGTSALALERAADAPPFRIFQVNSGVVSLSGVTIRDGLEMTAAGILNNGSLTLLRVEVTNNWADSEGSGIRLGTAGGILNTGSLTLRESFVHNNLATARSAGEQSLAAGGGVESEGTLFVERSTISANIAEAEGGENAEAFGGGLVVVSGIATIEESTISGNHVFANGGSVSNVSRGGGIQGNGVAITGSTITRNEAQFGTSVATGSPAGDNLAISSGSVIRNSIVSRPVGEGDNCANSITSGGFNLDEDGSCEFDKPTDLTAVVDGLEPLIDNGGPTPTHAPRSDSPIIDRGNSFGSGIDQRNLERPVDFASISNTEGGDGSDIGAFELQVPPTPGGGAPILVTAVPTERRAPNTRIVSGPPRSTFKRLAKFRFASSEPQSHFQCKLDKKKWKGCRNPYKRSVKPGKHLFKVRAIDRFGNVDPTPARFGWRVKPIVG